MIEANAVLSIRRQCDIVGLNRSTFYYQPAGESALNLHLMRLIDEQYLKTPFYGWPRMSVFLRQRGYPVNTKRVRRLMRVMDLQAIYPKQRTTIRSAEHIVYPYLLRNVVVVRPNHVWSADITYIPMLHGIFCLTALERALLHAQPEIFNTDQGVQFTSLAFTGCLQQTGIRISMDGRGRALDNVFVERLWRTVKYEHVYLHEAETVMQLERGLAGYFSFYNHERPHQSLSYQTPAQVYAQRDPGWKAL